MNDLTADVLCIGAGPAGLTASYLLSKKGVSVIVAEADPNAVGGISRTVDYKGFHFDIGGHRFFSKSQKVEDLWTEILPDGLLVRPRSSRIFYKGKTYSYPLRALEALFNLGVWESTLCVASYTRRKFFPVKNPRNFEEWVSNQFGPRLFNIFFRTYTEKVWGIKCADISADWAAQRIKGLSLSSAIWNALFPPKRGGKKPAKKVIKTLIDSFRYPRKGPGMMWATAAEKTVAQGGKVLMGATVTALRYDAFEGLWHATATMADGGTCAISCKHVMSSAPLRELVASLSPAAAPEVLEAARKLHYRDFITVALIVKDRNKFNDNWIYIHDPDVKVGRVQNFKAWSPDMVPDASLNCYGLEYFCFEGDDFWSSADEALIQLAKEEIVRLGLAEAGDIQDACVVRQKKAYPVYDDCYVSCIDLIRKEIAVKYPNLHLVGRNGMHKYNNQDHAMMTAMLTVENILAGKPVYDVWRVNQDAEYLETAST